MRSAHMIIQQKFLCLAAYEGYVHVVSTLNIEQQLTLVHNKMSEVDVNYVRGYPMIASHITNKEVSKQKVLYPTGYMVIIMLIGYNIHNK